MLKSVTLTTLSSLFNMQRLFFCILTILFSSTNLKADIDDTIGFPKAEVINDHTTRIPFKLVDHLIVVEAQLLNKKGNFIIDTGSETLILNSVHFDDKSLHNRRERTTYGVNADIKTRIRHIEAFTLHSLNLKDTQSDIIDLSHIEKTKRINLLGIIGHSLLKDFEVFVDLYLNQITLTRLDKDGNRLDKNVYLEKISDSIAFKMKNHAIILNTEVNGKTLRMALDTGAEYNQLNKSVSKSVLKYFKPKGELKLVGATGKKVNVLAGKLFRLKLNEHVYFGPMYTVLGNLRQLNEAFGTKIDGVLGYEFFKQKRTIINYKKKLLYFVETPLPLIRQ